MENLKDLRDFSPEEMAVFLNSFDTIMADCDGVLWHILTPIEGALETLNRLQHLGKRVLFVSNNGTVLLEDYMEKFKKLGFEATPDQIVIPSLVILWYLRKINFQGKAFVIGTKALQKVLKDGGIDVINGPCTVVESTETVKDLLVTEPDVKAVIFDFDINLSWTKMFQASLYLERTDVIFLTGALDRNLPISSTQSLLGVGQFADILIERTGKKPLECAKPGKILANYLLEHYGVQDPKRCIFVGDSLASDMKFAESCGFAKFWVGSGVDTIESCIANNIEAAADYYLPDLGSLSPLIDKSANGQHRIEN